MIDNQKQLDYNVGFLESFSRLEDDEDSFDSAENGSDAGAGFKISACFALLAAIRSCAKDKWPVRRRGKDEPSRMGRKEIDSSS